MTEDNIKAVISAGSVWCHCGWSYEGWDTTVEFKNHLAEEPELHRLEPS